MPRRTSPRGFATLFSNIPTLKLSQGTFVAAYFIALPKPTPAPVTWPGVEAVSFVILCEKHLFVRLPCALCPERKTLPRKMGG